MKTCVFDIETSDLAGVGPGFVLCAVIKELGSNKATVFRYDEMGNKPGKDKALVEAVVDCLFAHQVLIGHNIEGFDWPYLRTRQAFWGQMRQPPTMVTFDTLKSFRRCGFKTVPNIIGKPTARLDHIIDFFGLAQEKTALYPREHWVTVWGEGKERKLAMDKLVDHCVRDVRMTEEVFNRLWMADPFPHFQSLR
jgi:uncharacterized protein YprB with RNaseH-like and TPR domain